MLSGELAQLNAGIEIDMDAVVLGLGALVVVGSPLHIWSAMSDAENCRLV
jgi:hypothetical protein